MRKHLLLAVVMLLAGTMLPAQSFQNLTEKDYASYPHYAEMMLDQSVNFYETQKAFYTYWKDRIPSRGTGYKPFKRWEYYWQTRINPDGSFPEPDRVFREFMRYQEENLVSDRFKAGNPVWEEMGPKTRQNYGGYVGVGRINAIGFDPVDTLTIYIGAPSGGFWKTHDGGVSWETTTDHLPTLGVSAIYVHPDNPDRILIGTGDRDAGDAPGMGTMLSLDGGVNWEFHNNGMGNVKVGMFAISETDPDFILAASSGGVFKTTDGGANWTRTSPDQSNFRDVKMKPADHTVAYATSNTGFYRSEDSGGTWTRIGTDQGLTAPGRKVIGVTPANDSLVYIVSGGGPFEGCFLSRDFGQTFTLRSNSPNILGWAYEGTDDGSQAWYDLFLFADINNPNVIIVGGVNIWRSDDGGVTWAIKGHWWGDRTNEVHADHHTIDRNPLNNRVYIGNDGGIYYSDNLGDTWTEISEGLGIGQIYRLGVSNTNRYKTVTGFQDNGSATWMGTHWLNTGGGDGMECVVDPYDDRYSYTSIYYGAITRWINNATTRRVAGENTGGITESGAWVAPFFIAHDDPNVLVIGMKNIWMTTTVKSQGTISYTKLSNNLAGSNSQNMSELEQSPADFNIVYAARGDGKFFRTDNLRGNTTWNDLTSSLPSPGTVSYIETHPYDPFTVYIAHNNKIFKSTDKGAKWVNISGSLPNIAMNTIVCDKTSDEGIYVGSDAGVYYIDATLEDWVLFGTGLPYSVEVSELEIYYDRNDRAQSRLRASTYGRGMWETSLFPSDLVLPPSILTATVHADYITLDWAPPFYVQTLTSYRLYRNGEMIATPSSNSYDDDDIEEDVTYVYTVTAVYGGTGESRPSNEATATLVGPIELDYAQGFEKGNAGWSAKNTFEGWRHGTKEELGIGSNDTRFFGINSYSAGNGIHVTDYLHTPSIDLSMHKGKTITLKFLYTLRVYRTYDKLSVHYRVSPDSAWVKLADLPKPSITDWKWDPYEINLPEAALVNGTQIGFFYDDSRQLAWGAGIDDVELFHNTTSVFTLENSLEVSIFPNPAVDYLDIRINRPMSGTVEIKLFTLTGQTVIREEVNSNGTEFSHRLNLSDLASGVYQVQVTAGNGTWKDKVSVK